MKYILGICECLLRNPSVMGCWDLISIHNSMSLMFLLWRITPIYLTTICVKIILLRLQWKPIIKEIIRWNLYGEYRVKVANIAECTSWSVWAGNKTDKVIVTTPPKEQDDIYIMNRYEQRICKKWHQLYNLLCLLEAWINLLFSFGKSRILFDGIWLKMKGLCVQTRAIV